MNNTSTCPYASMRIIFHKHHLPDLGDVSLEFRVIQLSSMPNIHTNCQTVKYISIWR